MASAATVVEAGLQLEKRYRVVEGLEIFPLDSSSTQPTYVVRAGDDRSFVVSEDLKNLFELFDGSQTLDEVARIFSARQGIEISGHKLFEKISELITRNLLMEETGPDFPAIGLAS